MSHKICLVKTPFGTFHGFRADVVTDHLIEYGGHTRNELAMLLSLLRRGDMVADIGAHIGTFTVPIAHQVGPEGRVFAFEACRETFELLARNVEVNRLTDVVEPRWAIVTDQPGHYEATAKRSNTGATFFQNAGDTAGALPCVVPDQWFAERAARIDALKIDVEGMESAVLRACQGILKRDRPVLYVEINGPGLARNGVAVDEVQSLLNGLGYHYFRNVGPRNSATDTFTIARLDNLRQGGEFFDLLAVHPQSPRYPRDAVRFDAAPMDLRPRGRAGLPTRIVRRVRRLLAHHLGL